VSRLLGVIALALILNACGYPGKNLNKVEKQADIEWLFGTFERNYAPTEWKKTKNGVDIAKVKQECIEQSDKLERGDEFIALLANCVSRFQDAHTKTLANGTVLPENLMVAFLGFQTSAINYDPSEVTSGTATQPSHTDSTHTGAASADKNPDGHQFALKVEKLLATTKDPNFPVKANDLIVTVNDQPVKEYLLKKLVPYQDLGNEASSLVAVARSFPTMISSTVGYPKEDSIYFQVLRAGKIIEISLPWTKKDFLIFQKEQNDAETQAKKADQEDEDSDGGEHQDHSAAGGKQQDSSAAMAKNLTHSPGNWMGSEFVDIMTDLMSKFRQFPDKRVSLLLNESFKYFTYNPVLRFLEQTEGNDKNGTKEKDRLDKALGSITQTVDISAPPFAARLLLDNDGSRYGFIRVESFSIGEEEVKTFRTLLEKMNKIQVKGVIFDMLNNGGGSLVAGLDMANALTDKSIAMPGMQVALNDNWLNSFKASSLYAESDAEKTLASRIHAALLEDSNNGLRISRTISTTELAPYILNPDKSSCVEKGQCLKSDIKLVLLVNEMCASMCDIFASVFKDNKLGVIVGSQTMGAGGNVVMHGFSPVSQIALSQTESLIVDTNGQYLENQGVLPDYAVDTLWDRPKNYKATYKKAYELLK
jgi:hypothetical protein